MTDKLLEDYAIYKIDLELNENNARELMLRERIKDSYSEGTPPFVIISSTLNNESKDFKTLSTEKNFRRQNNMSKHPFFVINDKSDDPWVFYQNKKNAVSIESKGGKASGAYTFANIIKSTEFQELESVQSLLSWFSTTNSFDLKDGNKDRLTPSHVRALTAKAIDMNRINLQELDDNEFRTSIERISKKGSLLLHDDLRNAFNALGIDFHEISHFKDPKDAERIKQKRNLVAKNLLKNDGEKNYLEEKEDLKKFLKENKAIKITFDEVLCFLKDEQVNSESEESKIESESESEPDTTNIFQLIQENLKEWVTQPAISDEEVKSRKKASKYIKYAYKKRDESISLDGFYLTSLPESIGWLSNLEKLYLNSNYLEKLPESIGQLKKLRVLDCSYNYFKSLPDSISQLINLENLYCDCIELEELPDWIGQLNNLKSLNCSENPFKFFPDSIGRLKNLTVLDCHHSQLTSLPDSLFAEQRSRKLTIHVEENEFPDTEIARLHNLLRERSDISLSPMVDLKKEESKELTPSNFITPTEKSPYNYDDISPKIIKSRKESTEKFKNAQKSYEKSLKRYINKEITTKPTRTASGAVRTKVIGIDAEGNVLNPRDSIKNNGYDENFKTSESENGNWKKEDNILGLTRERVNFDEAFKQSRLPTNSYIHLSGKEDNSTTSHPGGLIKSFDGLLNLEAAPRPKSKELSVASKKALKEIKMKIEGVQNDPLKRREVSKKIVEIVKNIRGGLGGSSEGEEEFHDRRQAVIRSVIEWAKKGNEELKKASPTTATAEALKFVVVNTVGSRDYNPEIKFKGITTDGLNLEDETSEKYARKHYQAVRDTQKLAILKYEDRLNDSDTDSELEVDPKDIYTRIALLNKKLERTTLEAKSPYESDSEKRKKPAYHDEISAEKGRLSPLRYSSPYSRSNIDYSLDSLSDTKTYEEISAVYSSPIPTIRPTEGLIAKEKERREELDNIRKKLDNTENDKFGDEPDATPNKTVKNASASQTEKGIESRGH